MEIKRKLVGTQADMIEYLSDAIDAMVAQDVAMNGQREDTRIKKAERRGYRQGLEFAVYALIDWEPTKETTNGSQEEQQEIASTSEAVNNDEEPVAGVPRQGTGPTGPRPVAMRNPSSGNPPPAQR